MNMLSPLKPLLCRHDFYWSERHRAERCRRCGKLGEVEADATEAPGVASGFRSDASAFLPRADDAPDLRTGETPREPESTSRRQLNGDGLKAEAQTRRENLLSLLSNLTQGRQPSREEAIDAVLAVIEDAHSADPVLFGDRAADHFARLHEARARLAGNV